MKLYSIENGTFKVDGGAMFGTIPKKQWSKWHSSDADNNILLSMRSLLVDTGSRVILIDNGMGNKQSEAFYASYELNRETELITSLSKVGYTPDDVTDMVLTHLHFDHCGGSVQHNNRITKPVLTFPNAKYWVSRAQWENYLNPNLLESDSYFPEDMKLVSESGNLLFPDNETELIPGFSLQIFNGHTPGQLVPIIRFKNITLVYAADLIPLAASVQHMWISAYDINPLLTAQEKHHFLEEAVQNNYILFLEHDVKNECCTVAVDHTGFIPGKTGSLNEFFT
ncbi:MBL fold metallo-hydrolase [Saccharicrinis sp. FJH54]|uniref:MBL fold metallo-hydrolase n=1 Tax=Saccharicrinis sp. FJH54 TaxID=3344665 RepID=UPI0035D52356